MDPAFRLFSSNSTTCIEIGVLGDNKDFRTSNKLHAALCEYFVTRRPSNPLSDTSLLCGRVRL